MDCEKEKALMKRPRLKTIAIGLCAISVTILAFLALDYGILKSSARLLREGHYDAARLRTTMLKFLHPDEARFNTAVVLYQRHNYRDAAGLFEKSLTSTDAAMRAKASYNLGNCRYREAQGIGKDDHETARRLYLGALDGYRKASRLDPGDADALFNRALTEKRLEEVTAETEKRTGRPGKDGKSGRDDARQGGDAGARENGKTGKGQPDRSDKNTEAPEQKDGKTSTKTSTQPLKFKKGEMSREEAQMLLDEFRKTEKTGMQLTDKIGPGRHATVEKDW